MKISEPRFPNENDSNFKKRLVFELITGWRNIAQQINGITEGRIYAYHNASDSAPTSGDYNKGDFVLNKSPDEIGPAGSKYIVHGWRCVSSGNPGTWVEMRYLTGN